jgi:uncharacterized tellurite resistance protein B-like protein
MIALEQLKLLVNMAMADGNLALDERQYIKNIGKAHGYPESSVETLFYEEHTIIIPEKLSNDQRVEYAFTLTQLMLLDKKMLLKEIEFCSDIVEKLGFEKAFVYRLVDLAGGPDNTKTLETLKAEALEFLKSR